MLPRVLSVTQQRIADFPLPLFPVKTWYRKRREPVLTIDCFRESFTVIYHAVLGIFLKSNQLADNMLMTNNQTALRKFGS